MLGHRDFKTTLIYADDSPNAREVEWVEAAFAPTMPSQTMPMAEQQIPTADGQRDAS